MQLSWECGFPVSDIVNQTVRIGLFHSSLAARSKWPEFLSDGRSLQWKTMDSVPDDVMPFDVWVVGTEGDSKSRAHTIETLQHTGGGRIPVLVVLDAMEDQGPMLALKAEAYHEAISSAALLGQRLSSILPSPMMMDEASPTPSSLAAAEIEVWQTLFESAGAGLLKGRGMEFLAARSAFESLSPTQRADRTVERIREWMKTIQWELNNAQGKALLDLSEPVSLSHEFLDRITPVSPDVFLRDLLELGKTTSVVNGDWILRNRDQTTRHLSVEITLPETLENCILVTLLDISDRIQLEQDLRTHVDSLEENVAARTLEIRKTNLQLASESQQRVRLGKQVRDNLVHITQGLISAKEILKVALPGKDELQKAFPQSMLIERPRDILGGDFLFLGEHNQVKTLALIDSTGHGIPGSMVSLMGSMLINRAYAKLTAPTPSNVLHQFQLAFDALMHVKSSMPQMYGFDAGILAFDSGQNRLRFSGARGDLFLIRDGQAHIIRGTRDSIESLSPKRGETLTMPEFEEHEVDVQSGDQIYLITDGIRDQFGGERGRKLGRKRFADLLETLSHLAVEERHLSLENALLRWKGANAKVDDATLVGFDVP